MKTKLFILFYSLVKGLKFVQYENACGACLEQSPQNRFSCTECIDSVRIVNFCGKNIGNKLECPRGSRDFNQCTNAFISDSLIGTFQSNYYSMSPGDTCMITIQNAITNEESNLGFWKIWQEQMDLQFFTAKTLEETDDNNLENLKQIGKKQQLEKDQTYYLFVVNPTLEERHFQLNYAGSSWLVATF